MKENEINFEQAMQELEKIATELEKGDLGLDASVLKFEEGMNLSKKCSSFLEDAEKKITVLIQGTDGQMKEEVFDNTQA